MHRATGTQTIRREPAPLPEPAHRIRTSPPTRRLHDPARRPHASTGPAVQPFLSRHERLRWILQERHRSRSARRLVASRVRAKGLPASRLGSLLQQAIICTGGIPAPITLLVYPGLPGCSCPPCQKQPSKLGSTSTGGQPGKLDLLRNVRMHYRRANRSIDRLLRHLLDQTA